MTEVPPSPGTLQPAVPSALDEICAKCLTKKAQARFSSAGALALALQQAITIDMADDPSADETTLMTDGPPGTRPASVYQLRIISGPHDVGRMVHLRSLRTVIGRSPTCELSLTDPTKTVSRLHCVVIWNEMSGRYELMDLGSNNGSWVNGERVIAIRPLSEGDEIAVPNYLLKLEACRGS